MKDLLKEPIKQKIIFLIAIIAVTFMVVIAADTYLDKLHQDYETAYSNQLARHALGKVILRKLILVEKDLYRLASTEDPRDIDIFEKRLSTSLKDIKRALGVLQKGGSYEDVIPANFDDVNEIKERIFFSRDSDEGYTLEVIDLTPKLFDIENIAVELLQASKSKLYAASEGKQTDPEKIALLLKQADTFLLRSRESSSKIFYETNLEIERLETEKTEMVRLLGIVRNMIIITAAIIIAIISAVTFAQVGQILNEREAYAQNQQETNELLKSTIESLTHPFYVIDCNDYKVKMANSAAVPGDISTNLTCYALTHQQNVPCSGLEHPCPMVELRKTKKTITVEHLHRDKEGNPRTVEIHAYPIFNSQGEVVQMIEYSLDITERKKAEQALKQSEARYRLLAENATDIIWAIDMDLQTTYVSPALEQTLGYSVAEGETLNLENILTHSSYQSAKKMFLEEFVIEQRGGAAPSRTQTLEVEAIRKDGSSAWLEVKMRFLRDEMGRPTGALSVARDISERKNLEAQFRQAQKMEAVGRLAGGVAHDFNNLMTGVLGYCGLALGQLDEWNPARQDVLEIKKAGERAASLTRQLLAFSRQQVLEAQIINLNTIISNLEKMLRRLIGEDVELLTMLADSLGLIEVNSSQMEQIILNLVINARDAMPRGGKITLETANVDLGRDYARQHLDVSPGPYVMLAVSDTGHGMDEETKSHIFEPFFTTKEQGQGTGLGLATVHGIVKQSKGHIWLYTELEFGTTFKIYLPRIKGGLTPTIQAKTTSLSFPGTETILLVEDEKVVRELAERILTEKGYTVLQAQHGPEALQICRQHNGPIHLLLTDMVMPGGMNGRELAEQATQQYFDIKVLYTSSYTGNAIVHQDILIPELNFLQKPFSPDALTQKVREVLDAS